MLCYQIDCKYEKCFRVAVFVPDVVQVHGTEGIGGHPELFGLILIAVLVLVLEVSVIALLISVWVVKIRVMIPTLAIILLRVLATTALVLVSSTAWWWLPALLAPEVVSIPLSLP